MQNIEWRITMFKKGNKVYSILRGWGEVVNESTSQICVKFPVATYFVYYQKDGRSLNIDLNPELYHTEPVITVPKRRVEHTGWIAVDNEISGNDVRLTSAIIHEDNPERIMLEGRTYQQITYYTEE